MPRTLGRSPGVSSLKTRERFASISTSCTVGMRRCGDEPSHSAERSTREALDASLRICKCWQIRATSFLLRARICDLYRRGAFSLELVHGDLSHQMSAPYGLGPRDWSATQSAHSREK